MTLRLQDITNGHDLLRCIQCGTCSGSCPLTEQMDHAPRALFALIRDGEWPAALAANTPWFCVSCYQCMVRCPQDIPITDIMYQLKQLAVARGTVPADQRMPAMYRAFAQVAARSGRISEALVMALYGLRHPLAAVGNAGLGLALLKRRRLELLPRPIQGSQAISAGLTGVGYRKERP